MSATLDVKRTTPYGFQLNDGSYRNATPQVRNFVKDKLPTKMTIVEEDAKGVITKVSVMPGANPDRKNYGDLEKDKKIEEMHRSKIASVVMSYAKDLWIEGKIEKDEFEPFCHTMMAIHEELVDRPRGKK